MSRICHTLQEEVGELLQCKEVLLAVSMLENVERSKIVQHLQSTDERHREM